ncbi:acyl-CoA dehydrogenase family protein [Massilia sp. CCM 8734]|uniref:acyl-CoA dehydrogenase family protein n=1 Tax=Massilia sp. CCM 8734 TaxID=2609283 RepID=UPI001420BF38|nr:acyl-CoA dehydrogenase family protein [Massilia sp. CCM 8734]NIA00473.1 acyl-CoA dehydrogenase [Massilia sp. CCM 8734]
MDFRLSSEQQEAVSHIHRFARDVLSASASERIASSHFDRNKWTQASEIGLAGLPLPQEWGGSGFGALDTMLAVEALGQGCVDMGLVFSLCAHMFACAVPLWRHGSRELHERYLSGMAKGSLIAANAITEPGSGSDAFAMRSSARRDGEHYILNGEKCFVTNAPVADVFLLYAKTDAHQSYFGISAFLIPRATPGLTVTTGERKSGLCTSPWGSVHLDDCRVPVWARVGEEGAGATIFQDSMIWERGCLFAAYVGAMERVLAQCVTHARERQQFGRPIGHNQAVSDRLVDFKLRLETSRLLLYRAGWLYDQDLPHEEAIAQSKLWVSECAVQCGLDAIQIFGGAGVCSETGIDRLLLDALPARIFSGTNEIQREFIARHMGLR